MKKTVKKRVKTAVTKKEKKTFSQTNSTGMIYGLGLIGAAIYFISVSTTFRTGVVGFLKALVWPVFLVHGVLKYLGM